MDGNQLQTMLAGAAVLVSRPTLLTSLTLNARLRHSANSDRRRRRGRPDARPFASWSPDGEWRHRHRKPRPSTSMTMHQFAVCGCFCRDRFWMTKAQGEFTRPILAPFFGGECLAECEDGVGVRAETPVHDGCGWSWRDSFGRRLPLPMLCQGRRRASHRRNPSPLGGGVGARVGSTRSGLRRAPNYTAAAVLEIKADRSYTSRLNRRRCA